MGSGAVGIVSSFSAATVGVLGVVGLQPAAQLLQDARGRLQVGAVDPPASRFTQAACRRSIAEYVALPGWVRQTSGERRWSALGARASRPSRTNGPTGGVHALACQAHPPWDLRHRQRPLRERDRTQHLPARGGEALVAGQQAVVCRRRSLATTRYTSGSSGRRPAKVATPRRT
jgi:hypothetical protein